MSEDFYKDGFNDGYGDRHLNDGHDYPQSDGEKYNYRRGREDGERRRRWRYEDEVE